MKFLIAEQNFDNNWIKWILFFLLIIYNVGESSSNHPFYVSLTQIEHNSQTQCLEASIRIFTDDLQLALKNFQAKNNFDNNQLLKLYLKEHIKIWVKENQELDLSFVGKEEEEEVTWCYLESKPIKTIPMLIVQNTILFKEFPSQINMLHIRIHGKTRSTHLTRNSYRAYFEFN
ncbi:MAG: hypothetical protein RML72_04790 [Bacteroidia bacterium]|nr:hypothetical protein [Bacteroidia bacterium]MDW8158180.1 hypothetical protein [Bacteroidia bacterium]